METETENASQQTDWSLGTHDCTSSKCYKCCSKIGVCVSIILFVTFAFLFAIVFLGRDRIKHIWRDYYDSDYPKHAAMFKSLKEVNVNVTTVSKFPFVGALISINPLIFLCPTIIITNRYLLTGANCFTTNFQNLSIRVGSNYWNKDGYRYEIDRFIINDKFNFTTMENNIAIVRLKEGLKMEKNVKKTKFRLHFSNRTKKVTIVGWNTWAVEDYPLTTLLEQTKFILENRKCTGYLKRHTNLICVITHSKKCTLLDLTGPLLMDNQVFGFWSTGISCINKPSFYTNLIYHRKWIEKIILHRLS